MLADFESNRELTELKADKSMSSPDQKHPLMTQVEASESSCMMRPEVMFTQPSTKQIMKITKCPHTNRKHYAKNMCSSCYRKYGRNTFAFKCQHTDR